MSREAKKGDDISFMQISSCSNKCSRRYGRSFCFPKVGRDKHLTIILQGRAGYRMLLFNKFVTMPIYGKEALNICHPT